MRASTLLLCLAFGAIGASASAADTPPQQGASAPAAAPTTLTPANDPAYTYKTLRLNRAAFDALLAKPEALLVLDLRRPDELTRLGGFPVYLSIQTADLQKSLSYIPRDRFIVTVSNRAHRAGAAGDILSGLGYHVVGAIGVLDYQDEGGTLTKIAPIAPRVAASSTGTEPAASGGAK
jgi:rhodanese-related sulfurtransferase